MVDVTVFHKMGAALLEARAPHRVVVFGSSPQATLLVLLVFTTKIGRVKTLYLLPSGNTVYDEDDRLKHSAEPYSTDSSVLKKNHPLMIMVIHHQEDLLAHPLVTSLLRYKWDSFGRYFYYTNLFLYCIFLTFLTGYVVNTTAPYMYR